MVIILCPQQSSVSVTPIKFHTPLNNLPKNLTARSSEVGKYTANEVNGCSSHRNHDNVLSMDRDVHNYGTCTLTMDCVHKSLADVFFKTTCGQGKARRGLANGCRVSSICFVGSKYHSYYSGKLLREKIFMNLWFDSHLRKLSLQIEILGMPRPPI